MPGREQDHYACPTAPNRRVCRLSALPRGVKILCYSKGRSRFEVIVPSVTSFGRGAVTVPN
jgi:hypothetical protein